MISIILWVLTIVSLSIFIVSKKHRESVEIFLGAIGWFLLIRVGILLYQTGKQNFNITHSSAALPFGEQCLLLVLCVFFIINMTKNTSPNKWFEKYVDGFVLFCFILGLAQIIGALFFDYHWHQYTRGATFISIGLLFLLSKIKNRLIYFQISSVLSILIAISFYCYSSVFHLGSVQFSGLSNSIVAESTFISFIILFISSGIAKYGIIDEKQCGFIAKLCLSLYIASFLYYHPEIKVADLPIITETLKNLIAISDIGLLGYSSAALLFAS